MFCLNCQFNIAIFISHAFFAATASEVVKFRQEKFS